jgi:WhiB family redox-sensing transcriptional regulator
MSAALTLVSRTCPEHGRPVSGGPVVYRCDAGRLGHRVQAADLEVAAEGRWQDRARCAETDPDAFFPEHGESTREAEKVCAGCEVRAECLEFALDNNEAFGVWGGVPEHERHQLLRARAKGVAA